MIQFVILLDFGVLVLMENTRFRLHELFFLFCELCQVHCFQFDSVKIQFKQYKQSQEYLLPTNSIYENTPLPPIRIATISSHQKNYKNLIYKQMHIISIPNSKIKKIPITIQFPNYSKSSFLDTFQRKFQMLLRFVVAG